jgi:hypothetical protein
MAGPLSMYRFALKFGEAGGGRLTTPTPAVVERVRHRDEARLKAPKSVVLRYGTEEPFVRELFDLSRQGLAFVLDETDGFRRGSEIRNVSVDWQGRLRIRCRLRIRHVFTPPGETRLVAGARLAFDSSEDAQHWQTEVDALIDATIRTGGTWTRDTWELFEKSGYFSLSNKRPADFARLRDAFTDSSRKLARAPELGLQIVWPSGRGVEAAASVIALNHDAVFIYHMARRFGSPPVGATSRQVVHSVHHQAIRWIRAREFARWLVVWVQDAARFSKRVHLDFVLSHADGIGASVVKIRALEVPAAPIESGPCRVPGVRPSYPAPGGWVVREAAAEELARIAAAASMRFPPSFVLSHALDMPLEKRWDNWDSARLERGRAIVVAERDDRVEAAAICEWCAEGIHLFGLLDVVRVIPIGPAAQEAAPALIDYAKNLFCHLGKAIFVYACDPDVPEAQWPADAHDLGLTHCSVISTELLPELAEHAWEVIMGERH